jgi:hypothetical protein
MCQENSVSVSQRTLLVPITKTSFLMYLREIISVCSDKPTKHINGYNVSESAEFSRHVRTNSETRLSASPRVSYWTEFHEI